MTTDPITRHGVERELLERVAALEAAVQALRAIVARLTEPAPLRRS